MKKIILLLALFSVSAQADEWRQEDTYREAGFQVLNVIDWGQTRYIAEHTDKFHESESEQFIGRYPTTGRVDAFMAETAVIHLAISYLLPVDWRDAFQYISIGMKLNNTIQNANLGINVSF